MLIIDFQGCVLYFSNALLGQGPRVLENASKTRTVPRNTSKNRLHFKIQNRKMTDSRIRFLTKASASKLVREGNLWRGVSDLRAPTFSVSKGSSLKVRSVGCDRGPFIFEKSYLANSVCFPEGLASEKKKKKSEATAMVSLQGSPDFEQIKRYLVLDCDLSNLDLC